VTLLRRAAAYLADRDIAHAVIGAAALAIHGVSRSTLDQDLLVIDGRVLDTEFWAAFDRAGTVAIQRGDVDDPLAGVVRMVEEGERDVDIVVGRHQWQREILTRASPLGSQPIPVVEPADLVLLKLYAGGSQDRWDIEQLLALDRGAEIADLVDQRAAALPLRSREIWSTLRPQS
jgi:hypothetical protein